MNILLTGASGYLGSYLLQNLIKNNIVYTLSKSNANIICDLSLEIPKFINNFDLVIHSAGKAHSNPMNETEIAEFFNINVLGTTNLLNGISKYNLPKQFVFISSVSVYGQVKGENINEKHPLLAEDPYGKSKIEAEKIIIAWCNKHNVICTILRLPLVVGINPPGNLGAMIRGIKKGYYFNIAGGNAKKSMVLAADIAKFILKVSEIGGTYNLTDGFHPTFRELSHNISRKFGKSFVPNLPIFIAIFIAKFGDILGNISPINSNKLLKITSTLTFDDSKARQSFGWKPSPVLQNFSNI
jgi:nucleoside-diphosphate-sugar epimerase